MPSWWGWQTSNTLDRATAHLPTLLYERLDEIRIDFTLLYPSAVLALLDLDDVESWPAPWRRGANRWLARIFGRYRDRIAVGGLVPMNSSAHRDRRVGICRHELGLKTVVITGYARRSLGAEDRRAPALPARHLWPRQRVRLRPVLGQMRRAGRRAPCRTAPTCTTASSRSVSNYVYNHIGGLATSHESLGKSLFLGGVTRRFPALRFGFLEGGVAWACSLYADLLGHWSKRNGPRSSTSIPTASMSTP